MNNWVNDPNDPNNPNVLIQEVPPNHRKPSVKLWTLAVIAAFFIGGFAGFSFAQGAVNSAEPIFETPSATPSKNTPRPKVVAESPPAKPKPKTYGPGTYAVGSDIKAGKYKATDNGGICYWARLRSLENEMDIIANHFGPGEVLYVTIKKTDAGFKTTGDCGRWSKVS